MLVIASIERLRVGRRLLIASLAEVSQDPIRLVGKEYLIVQNKLSQESQFKYNIIHIYIFHIFHTVKYSATRAIVLSMIEAQSLCMEPRKGVSLCLVALATAVRL
jgi:hypothetical protein